ncbi:hypothetical protein WR25_03682 [Diploscapter pachys]|uniref:Uncharacterized protein n=1 Tax=Diploscapter pachys TaxID=2018661 RepID=A0A2A2LNV6_9BILA|nr:hypothetical protein WR25_03682 [Diploscapter pachys]
MRIGIDEPSPAAASLMSQFQLEQSSVIKTAPPGGRQLDFPKNEPLDLAPLTNIHEYYPAVNYTRVYEPSLGSLTNPAAAQAFALSNAQTSAAINYYPFATNGGTPVIAQDWSRAAPAASIDAYAEYQRHAYALHQQHPQASRIDNACFIDDIFLGHPTSDLQ